MKKVEVSRLVAFFICGSQKVIHISSTSSGAKKRVSISMFVRRKATFCNPCAIASLAPAHMRAPLISMPMKFFSGQRAANPTVYSPRPQPNSSTMGWLLWKYASRQCPAIAATVSSNSICPAVHWKTLGKVSISANFFNLFFPTLLINYEL